MSSQTRQRFLFQVEFQVIIDSAYRCSRSNVESQSTALFAVPGRMSSHTRQRILLIQVECRVTLLSASAVPGRMSSDTRQRFPPFQVECRVTIDSPFRTFKIECQNILDSAFRCSRSNVEFHSTSLSAFQVESRVTFHSVFCCSRSNVASHSTAHFAVPV